VPGPVAWFPDCGHFSDPHLERERFVYKWQVFLGGIASATFVLAGAAAPALAQTVASSPLTTVTQAVTGSQVSANVCDMAGSPLSGEVNSAMAGLTGQSCNASSTGTPKNASQTATVSNSTAQNAVTPAGLTSMTGALPGLNTVTGEIPGLGAMTSTLPVLNTSASQAPATSPASSGAKSTPLSNATVPSLGSNEPGSGATMVQNTLNGVTGTLPVSSLTGGLAGLGNVSGALAGVTGPQG
jgi:hypothetical protein